MPDIRVLNMGWDVHHAPLARGISEALTRLEARVSDRQLILMVGTLEPRKGHADALDAFELLDRQSPDQYALVIVGQPGWNTDELQRRLRSHPRLNQSLFWLDQATDDDVARLYGQCAGVLVTSHAEGFGLPIIEALGHGKPVLARDIPVFHTLSTDGIAYFPADATPQELATALGQWLDTGQARSGAIEPPPLPTWRDVARQLVLSLQEAH
jgi:glycosyltransferase involved in cell wall biosynthesis